MNLRQLIASDLDRFSQTARLRGQKPYGRFKLFFESLIFKPGFQAVLLYRLSHWFHLRGWTYCAWSLSRLNQLITGAEIEFNAKIGPGLFIAHPGGIMVGRGTEIGERATLFHGVTFAVRDWHPERIRKFPKVGDDCVFFTQSGVFGECKIGDRVVVGAHAVVLDDIPAGALAIGQPAQAHLGKGAASIESWGT